MNWRNIGDTGIEVSALGFGGAPIGGLHEPVSEEASFAAVQAAIRTGITYFDTAPLYGRGLSEHRLGRILRQLPRGTYTLSSKVGRVLKPSQQPREDGMFYGNLPFDSVFDYSYDGTMRSVEDSFQRLGLDRLDIIYIHDVSPRWHGHETTRLLDVALTGAYKALLELKRTNFVRAIGVGVNDANILAEIADLAKFDVFMLATRYTLLDQSALDALFPVCRSKGISIAIAGPFAGGVLASDGSSGGSLTAPSPEVAMRLQKMRSICHRYGVPLAAAALQFVSAHPVVTTVVVGCRSAEEVAQNVELREFPIPPQFWVEMKEEAVVRADAPTPSN